MSQKEEETIKNKLRLRDDFSERKFDEFNSLILYSQEEIFFVKSISHTFPENQKFNRKWIVVL